MKTKILDNFIPTPRAIVSDVKNGLLTPNEFVLYVWLRLQITPYGITSANISAIQEDMFKDVTSNYVNRLLLSLRRKKYIYFKNRQGRRGSFEVHFGDIALPNGGKKTLEALFSHSPVKSLEGIQLPVESEVAHYPTYPSQKSVSNLSPMKPASITASPFAAVRSIYNDTKTEIDIDKVDSSSSKKLRVANFIPNDSEEQRCKEIATTIGEEFINFPLSILKKYGVHVLEQAYGALREQVQAGTIIKSKPAYFNGIVSEIINKYSAGGGK